MIKIKYLTIMLLLFIVNNNNVNAICMNSSINNYKKEAEKVEVSYEYNDDYYLEGKKVNGTYKVIVKNMPSSMYAEIFETDIKFEYEEDNNIENVGVESGIKNIIIYHKYCNEKLKTIKLNLKKYNKYAERNECIGINGSELDVCDKWYPYELNESIFLSKLKEYNDNKQEIQEEIKSEERYKTINSITSFFENYYFYIFLGIVLILSIVLIAIKRKKKYTLE